MDISQVFEAIRALHDPRTSQPARQSAHQFCESLKADDGAAFALAGQLILPSLAHEIRYFGLQLYEHLITKKWARLPEQNQQELKAIALQIICSNTRPMLEEVRYIKEKAVQLVGLIAQREWPARWPELLPTLTQLTQAGETQCELALLSLRSIVQGIFDDASMMDARRNELLVALNSEYAGIYAFCYEILDRHFRSWSEASTAGNANSPQSSASQMLVTVALQTFETYAPLSSIQAITDSGVLPALLLLLHAKCFREVAISVLVAILAKKTKETPHVPLVAFIQGMLESCGPGGLLAQTDYDFHKRLCTALTDFGCNYFSILHGEQLSQTRNGYLGLMASFTGHSAVFISTITLPFWRSYLDSQLSEPQREPMADEVHACLLRSVSDKISRPVQADDGAEDSIGDEFNDWEEYERFWSQAKAKYLEVVRKLAAVRPAAAVNFAGMQWQAALFGDPVGDDAAARAKFDALCSLLDTVMGGLPEHTLAGAPAPPPCDDAPRAQVVAACEMLANMFLQLDASTDSPLVAAVVTRALPLLGPYFRTHPQLVPHLLRTMLTQFSTFTPAPGDPPARREQVASLRRRLSVSAVRLAQAAAAALLPYRDQIQQVGQELMARGAISVEETSHLYELFFVMSTPLASQEDWGRFIGDMMVQPLAAWTSPDLARVVEDYPGWLAPAMRGPPGAGGAGGGEAAAAAAADAEMEQARQRLQGVLVTLLCIFRRCVGGQVVTEGFKQELSGHVVRILPPLAALIASVHAVWDPAVRAAVHPAWALVYKAVEYDKAVDPTYRTPLDLHSPANELATWLRHVRDAAYQLAGVLTAFADGFYGAVAADPGLLERLFRHLPSMEDRHVRSLLRLFLGPFLRHCPPPLHARVLAPLVPPLLGHVLQRLQRGYADMAARDAGGAPAATAGAPPSAAAAAAGGGGGGSEKDEIVADQVVRLLHREVIEMILTLIDPTHAVIPLAAAAAAAAAGGGGHAAAAAAGDGHDGHGAGPGARPPATGAAAAAATAPGGPASSAEAAARFAAGSEELTMFFLGTESGAAMLLGPVWYSLQWQDSAAAQRAVLGVLRLLPRARTLPHLQPLLAHQALAVAVDGVRSAGPAEGDRESALLGLLRDIYAALAPLCPAALHESLARLTGAGPDDLQRLHEALARNAGSKKTQRQLLLQLLKPGGAAAAAAAAGGGGAAAPTLPDAGLLALYRRRKEQQSWTDSDAASAWAWLEEWS